MRMMQSGALAFLLCLTIFGSADDGKEIAVLLTRSDSIPQEGEKEADPYFEGYLQALIDMHYAEYRVIVIVKDRRVWLANLPNNAMLSNSIIAFVRDVPGVEEIIIVDGLPPQEEEI